jgi:hypothetical protein
LRKALAAPAVLALVACQVGQTDVQLGFHVTSNAGGSGGREGQAGASTTGDTCTLLTRQGPVTYQPGEAARLDGTLQLTAERTGKCARATDCASEPADVEQSTCDEGRCQLWQALDLGESWFVLTNLQNGGCLDVGNGSTIDAATIQAFPCHARPNQQWQAVCAGGERFRLFNRHSSLLLGVHNADEGGLVQQWSDSEQDPDLWRIAQRPDAYVELVATSEQVGQAWRHVESAPADGWQQPAFDDAGWSQGLAAFGTRYDAPWTPRTDWNSPELWLRRSFTLEALPPSLDLRLFHNGPVEVYVNGNLAYQGGASVGYRIAAANEAALASLAVGENSVAARVARNSDGAFGPYFDLGLGRLLLR